MVWRGVVAPAAERDLRGAGIPQLDADQRVARVGLVAGLLLLLAWFLRGLVQILAFRDPFVPLSEDVSFLLFETFWGTVWMAQGVVVPLLALAFWRAGRGRGAAAWIAATVLTLALVATMAMSSHAMGVDSWRAAIVLADGLHTLAAGAWIGTLGIILWVSGAVRSPGRRDGFAAQIRAFSPVAIAGVTGLLSMGIVLSWTHLTALSDFWTTGYGRLLAAKIAVAIGVMLAGWVNWRRGVPTLATEAGALATRRRAVLEVSLAVGVLILTAFLVHSAKP